MHFAQLYIRIHNVLDHVTRFLYRYEVSDNPETHFAFESLSNLKYK